MREKPRKPRRSLGERLLKALRDLIILIISLAMVALAVLTVLNRDRLNLDGLKRWVAYGTLDRDEAGRTEEFDVSAEGSSAVASLGDSLVVCTGHNLRLYSRSGETVTDQAVSMNNPILHTEGSCGVAYDVGGESLYVLRGSEVVFSHQSDAGCKILSARVNALGGLVVVEQTSGHKATVTVYDEKYRPQIGVNESTNFVSDAVLSPDGRTVAVLELYQDESDFGTDLVFYNAKDAVKQTVTHLGSDIVIDLRWKGERIWAQRESGITVLDKDGNIQNSWSRSNKYLSRYCLDGTGYAVEFLSKYRSGGAGELRIIGTDGEQSVSRSVNEEVLAVSAAGHYVAVLSTSTLMIFKDDLQEYASLVNLDARRAIMRSDGSVLLIGTEKARLYIP